MNRVSRMVAVPLALAALLILGSSQADAQSYLVTPAPVVSYYTPPVVYAPTVSYYAPVPTVSYYYAPPVVTYSNRAYYAPAVVYPATTVTTYRQGVIFPRFRTIVTTTTYP